MDYEQLKVFFKKYPNLKEEKLGLYRLLMYPYFRKEYEVSMEEAGYLATVEVTEIESDSALAWARELRRYRKERENEK